MKILFAAPVTFDKITFFISHYVTGLARAARALGHEARVINTPEIIYNPRRGRFLDAEYETLRRYSRSVADFPQDLMLMLMVYREVKEFQPDILFIHLIDTSNFHLILNRIKKTGTRVFTWLGIHPSRVSGGIHKLAKYSDHTLIYDPSYIDYYEQSLGIRNTRILPLGSDIEYYDSIVPDTEFIRSDGVDICFYGMIDERRKEYLRALSGFNIGIWCWDKENLSDDLRKFHRGEAYGDDLVKILKSSKIAINIHRELERSGGNYRLFEIPASGTMQLVDEKEDIRKYFEIDKEIVTFSNTRELVEKAAYYIENDDKRKEIAEAGHEKVRREHNLRERMQRIIELAGA